MRRSAASQQRLIQISEPFKLYVQERTHASEPYQEFIEIVARHLAHKLHIILKAHSLDQTHGWKPDF